MPLALGAVRALSRSTMHQRLCGLVLRALDLGERQSFQAGRAERCAATGSASQTGLSETFRIARCRYTVTRITSRPLLQDWWLTKYVSLTDASVEPILKYAIEYSRINVLEWLADKRVLPSPWPETLECDKADGVYWLDKRGYLLSVYVITEIEKNNYGVHEVAGGQ